MCDTTRVLAHRPQTSVDQIIERINQLRMALYREGGSEDRRRRLEEQIRDWRVRLARLLLND